MDDKIYFIKPTHPLEEESFRCWWPCVIYHNYFSLAFHELSLNDDIDKSRYSKQQSRQINKLFNRCCKRYQQLLIQDHSNMKVAYLLGFPKTCSNAIVEIPDVREPDVLREFGEHPFTTEMSTGLRFDGDINKEASEIFQKALKVAMREVASRVQVYKSYVAKTMPQRVSYSPAEDFTRLMNGKRICTVGRYTTPKSILKSKPRYSSGKNACVRFNSDDCQKRIVSRTDQRIHLPTINHAALDSRVSRFLRSYEKEFGKDPIEKGMSFLPIRRRLQSIGLCYKKCNERRAIQYGLHEIPPHLWLLPGCNCSKEFQYNIHIYDDNGLMCFAKTYLGWDGVLPQGGSGRKSKRRKTGGI